MPKNINRKKYQPPMVYDIGGPNLNVVGTTYLECEEGSGGGIQCSPGGTGVSYECDAGDRVTGNCGVGMFVGDPRTCGTGSSAGSWCGPGKPGGSCTNGLPG